MPYKILNQIRKVQKTISVKFRILGNFSNAELIEAIRGINTNDISDVDFLENVV